jgi:hypothetical protein
MLSAEHKLNLCDQMNVSKVIIKEKKKTASSSASSSTAVQTTLLIDLTTPSSAADTADTTDTATTANQNKKRKRTAEISEQQQKKVKKTQEIDRLVKEEGLTRIQARRRLAGQQYKTNKWRGKEGCRMFLTSKPNFIVVPELRKYYEASKKKDDLAECLLQGIHMILNSSTC